jgi:hypothetical protein
MKSYVNTLLVLVPAAFVGVLVGCAEGVTDEATGEDFLATSPLDAGKEENNSAKIPPPSNPSSPTDDPDAGTDPGPDPDTSDAGGGGGGVACTSPNNCSGANNLGNIRGDKGADSKTAQGHTSQWFTVRVTEDDHSVDGSKLKVKATLTSPPGTNFDLYVYVPSGDTLACAGVTAQSVLTTATDSASASFGEGGLFSNGSDDDRTVTVEVRHVSGTCDPSQKWSLTVAGNQ